MTITDLIKALESAEGPSRELDWGIADLFGEVPEHTIREIGFDYDWFRRPNEYALWKATDSEGRQVDFWQPPAVTASVDAAIALCERVLSDAEFLYGFGKIAGGPHARIWAGTDDDGSPVKGANLAIALVIATLKAKESETP